MARYQVGIQTEARIYDATRELLAESGLEGTTLKAICDRAGVRAGSFYNLFSSKEEVILRVVREAIDAVDPDPEHEGRNDSLDDLIDAYIAFFSDQRDLARIYIQIAISGSGNDSGATKGFLRHHERRVERFAAALRHRDPDCSPRKAAAQAEVILGALDGLAFRWVLDDSFDFARYARLVGTLRI
jgi:AcrR family transcriptional regulator